MLWEKLPQHSIHWVAETSSPPMARLRPWPLTVIDPVIEIGFNKTLLARRSRSRDTAARPTTDLASRVPEATQRTFTGQAYMGISKAINSLTGGTDYRRGNSVNTWACTVPGPKLSAADPAQAGEGHQRHRHGQPRREGQTGAVPITGRFYGEVDRDRVDMSRYYEAGKKIRRVESSPEGHGEGRR